MIAIRNMDMPKGCDVCIFKDKGHTRCWLEGNSWDPDPGQPRRPKWCPLVEAPDGKQMDWISVEDRLPEPYYKQPCEVLVRYQWARGDTGCTVGRHIGHGNWQCHWKDVTGDYITHWMPIPKPPETESTNA